MEPRFSQEQLEDLKAWAQDPRGEPFWTVIREMVREGIGQLRVHARHGEPTRSAFYVSHVDTLEEVLDLARLIIEDHADKAQEGKSGQKA